MLWSLIKILFFVAAITALTYGGMVLMEVDGGATIEVAGISLVLSPIEIVFAFVGLVVAVWIGLKVLGLLVAIVKAGMGDETALSRYLDRNRERKGYEALSEGLMALASGEGHLALTKAARAERFLGQPHLTNLLTAQAAELTGDRRKAEATYKQLLTDDRTRFVGVNGIMKQKLSDGDTDTALALAKKAFALKPKHGETHDVLLKLQAEKSDWAGARETLNAKLKVGDLPRDVHKRRDAVLALSEAADGNARYASRVLTQAWSVQPHPELASAFAEIAPEEDTPARLKRFRALVKQAPDHPETKMLLAELHISAEDFPEAKRALGDLVETDATARNLTLMAAIERGQGADDSVVRGWLTRALTASRGPQWICDNCQHIHGQDKEEQLPVVAEVVEAEVLDIPAEK